MANNKKSSPDFNDEYLAFGLEEFRNRLRQRLNDAEPTEQKQTDSSGDQPPAEVDGWQPSEMPEDAEPDPRKESCREGQSWQRMFLIGRDGPKGCAQNLSLIFENDERWQGVFAENLFTGAIEVMKQPPVSTIAVGELDDQHVAIIHCWIEQNYEIVANDSSMRRALINVAAQNRYHPVQDYLNGLPVWDQKPRCDEWLKEALGAGGEDREPPEYLAAIGARFLIGACRRIMNAPKPTKVDNMLIFEGLQGDGKSTLIYELFHPWHGDTPLPLGDKDSYINIRGCWGYEWAELDSLNKAGTSTAKSFIASPVDKFRPPFGTRAKDYPRQTVFIGSVNHTEYLTDSTGNRRYWPVWAHAINVQWLRDNRQQLWAEALHRCVDGQNHWIDKKSEPDLVGMVMEEQAFREHSDAWESKILVWLWNGPMKSQWSSHEILEQVIEIDIRSVTRQHENRIADAMKKVGFKKNRRKRVEGGKRPYLYSIPDNIKPKIVKSDTSAPAQQSGLDGLNEAKF